jgi:hypothetical protein
VPIHGANLEADSSGDVVAPIPADSSVAPIRPREAGLTRDGRVPIDGLPDSETAIVPGSVGCNYKHRMAVIHQ